MSCQHFLCMNAKICLKLCGQCGITSYTTRIVLTRAWPTSNSQRSYWILSTTQMIICTTDGDRVKIDYPKAEVRCWTKTRKEGLLKLKIFQHWRGQYQVEVTQEAKKQHALRKFGFTAERPEEGGCQRASTRIRRR